MQPLRTEAGSAAQLDKAALMRVALFLALAVLLASAAPPALFAAALSSVLGLAAVGVGLVARIGRERLRPDHRARAGVWRRLRGRYRGVMPARARWASPGRGSRGR
jgi:hypothetical protein